MTTISRHLRAETPDVVFPRRDPLWDTTRPPPFPDDPYMPWPDPDPLDTEDEWEDDDDES